MQLKSDPAGRGASGPRRKPKKGKTVQLIEYGVVLSLLFLVRLTPLGLIRRFSKVLGSLFFRLVKKRRLIALNNLSAALGKERDEVELRDIARESFASFFLTYFEIAKFQSLMKNPGSVERLVEDPDDVRRIFEKAKGFHDAWKGCIFVTPHIGNWEMLPHVSAAVGIPLVIVARPLDNVYLERVLYRDRAGSGQVIIPKRNALFVLQKTLQDGKSIGMLPDQSTMQGISVPYFGRNAFTTPVPAILSALYKRPLVVVACCRNRKTGKFEGVVSDPILPGEYKSEKEEIHRLTELMNRTMEDVVRKYPEQYLWMHNRWKTYTGRRARPAGA
ncbi:MAG TPA: lysophospholipid acyltransferase family protein [Dissulfurispiraceae bacterium]|nr:lysophospholipid acyltransferase family protein [Dissulfurispiraceae bacterium]